MSAGGTVENLPPSALREVVGALWHIRPPEPYSLFQIPQFVRLREACMRLYPESCGGSRFGLDFALGHAVGALGLPGRPLPARRHLALPAAIAAARLHAAFERKQGRRVYLCPLDRADDLPELKFGPNRIARLTGAELEELVDLPRLRRINATWTFDAKLLSKFTWLVIEQTYPLDRTPAERAILLLSECSGRDWGEIEPHRLRFLRAVKDASAVEDALFAMLLAPWEDWVDTPAGWWRPFEVPWVYEVDDDLFRRPPAPPSADALSWDYMLDESGEEIFVEPDRVPLNEANVSEWLNDARWADLAHAQETPLFETPIKHFFVKAFIEDPLGEFLAHLTTIEAALGLKSDYPRKGQPRPPKAATKLMADRVSALLGADGKGKAYCRLFNLRSTFLHGRKMDAPIPGAERLMARRLARKVVGKLVKAALTDPPPQSREAYLHGLRP